MENNNAKWVNYGDANPLEHGGIWVLSDEEKNGEYFKGCYYITKFNPDSMIVTDLYVNINDEWIDKEKVMNYTGMTTEDFDAVRFAIDCTEYYNELEFGGNTLTFKTIEQVKECLENAGIEL